MASGIVPGKSVRRSLICVSREPSYYLLSIFSFPPSPTIHESFLHDSLRPSFCLVSRSLLACISGPLKIEESHRDTGRETNETRGNRLCRNAMSFLSLFLSPQIFPQIRATRAFSSFLLRSDLSSGRGRPLLLLERELQFLLRKDERRKTSLRPLNLFPRKDISPFLTRK